VSVDNRYTGVGYEPPFETPSDKDFMASHIEALESRVRELEDERDFQHGRAEAYHNESVKYRDQVKNLSHLLEKMAGRNQDLEQLRSRHAALVDVANVVIDKWERNIGDYAVVLAINKLKAALAEVKK